MPSYTFVHLLKYHIIYMEQEQDAYIANHNFFNAFFIYKLDKHLLEFINA